MRNATNAQNAKVERPASTFSTTLKLGTEAVIGITTFLHDHIVKISKVVAPVITNGSVPRTIDLNFPYQRICRGSTDPSLFLNV